MPNDLAALSDAQLRALERQYLPLSDWTDDELKLQEHATRTAAAAAASSPDLTVGEGLSAAGRGAVEGLGNVASAIADEPFVRGAILDNPAFQKENLATALDVIPGPVAGAVTAASGYGLPAAGAMAGSAAALGHAGANALRGQQTSLLEPAAYGAVQAAATMLPATGSIIPARLAVQAPRLAAAAELGAQMTAAGATGTGLAALYQNLNGEPTDWREALKVGGVTALLGGIGGALQANEVAKLAQTDREGLVLQARKLGFDGKNFDELKSWYKEAEDAADVLATGKQQNAAPVAPAGPGAEAEGAIVPMERTAPETTPAIAAKPLEQMSDAELVAAAQAVSARNEPAAPPAAEQVAPSAPAEVPATSPAAAVSAPIPAEVPAAAVPVEQPSAPVAVGFTEAGPESTAPGFSLPQAQDATVLADPAPAAAAPLEDPQTAAMPAPPAGTPVGLHQNRRMPVTMERILPGQVDVPTVMDSLENVVRVAGGMAPIRKGRFYQQANGVYSVQPDVIRLNHADNIPTAAHEVAHAVSKQIFGGTNSTKLEQALQTSPVARAAIAELRNLGRQLYGNKNPAAGYTAEGFSELLRLWLTTEDAPRRAPKATQWLEQELLAGKAPLAEALRTARDQIDLWRGQGAEGRAAAQMKDPPGRLAKLRDFVRNHLSRQAQVEEFAPLEAMSEGFAKVAKQRLAPAQDPFLVASALRKTAGPTVETMVDRGMVDLWGNITGPSLKEALGRIKPHEATAFSHYLWARRAIERWGKRQNPGMALEDATYLRQKLETPEFAQAAAKYYQWWDGILEYVKSASPGTNGPLVDAIRANSHDYVPLARELDPARVRAAAAGAGGGGLQRMHGSGLPVKNLYLQSLLTAEKLVARAHRDLVLDSILNLSQHEGMGFLVERVPQARAMEQISIERIRRELEGLGVDTASVPDDTLLTYATHADTPKGTDPIVARKGPGGVEWYQVPADVYELLQGVEAPARLGWAFELIFGAPARLFKLGTTGLRASFSLVTNPARDFPTFMLQSIAGNPSTRVSSWLGSMGDIVKAGLGGKESPELELFHQLGISAANYLGGDVQQARRAAKGLFHGKTWRMIRTPIETAREALSFSETAPRLAELSLMARELGWKPGQPLTPNQAVALRVAAKRVTTDFSSAGREGREINRAIPFYNASIQGLRGFARAFKENQGVKQKRYAALRAVLNGLTLITLPALYNWWKNKDEEWYRMLPWRERWLYLNVERKGTVYQVPLPAEWGSSFATLPIGALDAWWHKDPEPLKQAFAHIFAVVNPLNYPTLLNTAKEQWSNHIDFFDRPIVPRGEIDLLAGAQRSPYSSWLAKALGDTFPQQVSPRRVDAALREVFGGAAAGVADAPAALQRALGLQPDKKDVRESEPADLPVLGRLFRHGGTFTANNQALIDYWDDLDKYSAWRAANVRAQKTGQQAVAPMAFRDQAYAQRLEGWQPVIQISLQLAARTPELDKRQALYRRAAEQARNVMKSRPPAE